MLEEGLDYTPVSLKPGDLLLTENRKDTVGDICKLFNIPESLVDVTKIKYGSLEQNNIHFLQYILVFHPSSLILHPPCSSPSGNESPQVRPASVPAASSP